MSSKSGISEKLKGLRDRIEKLNTHMDQANKALYADDIEAVIEAERDPKRIAEIIAEIERRKIADKKVEKENRKENKEKLKKYIEHYNAGKIPIKNPEIKSQSRDNSWFGGRTLKRRSNTRKSMKINK